MFRSCAGWPANQLMYSLSDAANSIRKLSIEDKLSALMLNSENIRLSTSHVLPVFKENTTPITPDSFFWCPKKRREKFYFWLLYWRWEFLCSPPRAWDLVLLILCSFLFLELDKKTPKVRPQGQYLLRPRGALIKSFLTDHNI
uniref:Uncharacterized protein n=1 Tax=Microbotryum lychnidis-dioicae TaxID=288795 RepID=M1GPE0_9BASI|nr:hypothetical protein H911_mgp32 [Microbotryum lychnidis-dioicae]AGE14585.1 hypothetical protein [Microbotryum lychnidis-dioicae]